ncbi:MAG: CHASE2 domain-containing protein, partial [Gammaproteobacteria bacterium]
MHNIWNRFIRTENVFLAALLVSTTLLLAHQGSLWRLDQYIYDAQLKFWQRAPSSDIVIIAVDKPSLDKLGNWPWPADYHTRLLSRLAQDNPRAVAFYLPLPLSDTITQKPETELFDSLRKTRKPALSITLDQYADIPAVGELADFLTAYSIATVGHINVLQDKDGIVRSTYLAEGVPSRLWNNLNLQVSGKIYEQPNDASDVIEVLPLGTSNEQQKIGYDRRLIPFTGPPGHIHHVSYYKLLTGEIFPGEFNDKYVLIGMTDTSTGRNYPIPNSGFSNPMSLVEINANILDSFLNNLVITPATHRWNLAFSGFLALLPFFFFPFFTPRGNVIVIFTLIAITLATSLVLVFNFYIWLPPSTALVALVLSYLLWSSRRLTNAVQYLDKELHQFNTGRAYIETTINSKLDSIFIFLEKFLPIAGWKIIDHEGRQTLTDGNPPDLSNKQFIQNRWSNDGIDYWTSLTIHHTESRIGVRWSNTNGPTRNEKDYMDRLLRQLSDNPEKNENTSHEVVQNLILQVQEAIINLRNTHKFLDDSLAHMADGVLVTNEVGKILLVNNRAVTYLQGDNNNDLVGKDIFQLLDRLVVDDNVQLYKLLGESIVNGLSASTQASNATGKDLLLQITPLSRGYTGTSNVIFNLSDISHLKSIERARNETLSFVSHDLRSPLVSILALLELAKNRESSEEIRILHKRIEEYTQLTISLAEQFIQLARVESDASIKYDTIDLVSIAINAHEQTWVQAQSKDIHM